MPIETSNELERVNNCLDALTKLLNELNEIMEYTNKSLEQLLMKLDEEE